MFDNKKKQDEAIEVNLGNIFRVMVKMLEANNALLIRIIKLLESKGVN